MKNGILSLICVALLLLAATLAAHHVADLVVARIGAGF